MRVFFLLFIFLCTIVISSIYADEILVASLPKLFHIADSIEKGPFVELIKAIDKEWEYGVIKITGTFPFPRSIENVIKGKADFHIPIIRTSANIDKLPYRHVSESPGEVAFIIYSHKDKKITKEMIKENPRKYKLGTWRGQTDIFEFHIKPFNNANQVLRLVNAKKLDAFIAPQAEADGAIRKLELSSIHRELYRNFTASIIISKERDNDKVDKILSSSILKLKRSGELKRLWEKIQKPYEKWQPWQMGWK